MIEWKKYSAVCVREVMRSCRANDDPDPTMLIEGARYIILTDNGTIRIKKWYGADLGGFRTVVFKANAFDDDVLYYSEMNYPEGYKLPKKHVSKNALLNRISELERELKRMEAK